MGRYPAAVWAAAGSTEPPPTRSPTSSRWKCHPAGSGSRSCPRGGTGTGSPSGRPPTMSETAAWRAVDAAAPRGSCCCPRACSSIRGRRRAHQVGVTELGKHLGGVGRAIHDRPGPAPPRRPRPRRRRRGGRWRSPPKRVYGCRAGEVAGADRGRPRHGVGGGDPAAGVTEAEGAGRVEPGRATWDDITDTASTMWAGLWTVQGGLIIAGSIAVLAALAVTARALVRR